MERNTGRNPSPPKGREGDTFRLRMAARRAAEEKEKSEEKRKSFKKTNTYVPPKRSPSSSPSPERESQPRRTNRYVPRRRSPSPEVPRRSVPSHSTTTPYPTGTVYRTKIKPVGYTGAVSTNTVYGRQPSPLKSKIYKSPPDSKTMRLAQAYIKARDNFNQARGDLFSIGNSIRNVAETAIEIGADVERDEVARVGEIFTLYTHYMGYLSASDNEDFIRDIQDSLYMVLTD
jgi:hypothetical protein